MLRYLPTLSVHAICLRCFSIISADTFRLRCLSTLYLLTLSVYAVCLRYLLTLSVYALNDGPTYHVRHAVSLPELQRQVTCHQPTFQYDWYQKRTGCYSFRRVLFVVSVTEPLMAR
eukprot:2306645-Rhodomonas_salina.1